MKEKRGVFTRSITRRKGLNGRRLLLTGAMKLMLWAFITGLLSGTIFIGAVDAADVATAGEAGKRIGAGYNHSLALKADGTVKAWGNNTYGQREVPAGLGEVTSVSAGYRHSLALKADGTVAAWGANGQGQINVPAGLSGVIGVEAGRTHSLALKADGTVVAWGNNTSGQGLTGVVAISTVNNHSLALKADGTVVAWGANGNNQCDIPAGLSDVMAVSAGYEHSLALKSDGTVEAWGRNVEGQSNVPAGLSDVVAVSAGAYYSMVLKSDGTVQAWGSNNQGQCYVPAGLYDVVAVSAGHSHAIALKSDGTVVAWGGNANGQSNVPAGLNLASRLSDISVSQGVLTPVFDADIIDYTVHVASSITDLDLAATLADSTGQLYVQGQSQTSGVAKTIPLAVGSNTVTLEVATPTCGLTRVYTITINREVGKRIATGANHSLALKSDGTVVAWGDNAENQCDVPVGLSGVVAVSGGFQHSLALKSDGMVVAWGDNAENQCDVPAGLSGVVAVSAGYYHSLALKSDGTVVAWGRNSHNQCNVPSDLSGVVAVSAGYYHSLTLKSDGTVVAWGAQFNMPAGLSGVAAVSAGNNHSLALKSDDTVVAWGANGNNQCDVPAELSDVVAVSAGAYFSLALKSDGTVAAWGYYGNDVPSDLSGVVAVAGGISHSLALKSDGTVVAWGTQTNVPAGLNLAGRLFGLTVSAGDLTPAFNADNVNYAIDVDNSITALDMTATLADSTDLLYVQGQSQTSGMAKTIPLAVGTNNVTVDVITPPYGLTRTYTVTVSRAPVPVVNATIGPSLRTFDLNNPTDVITTVTWNSAQSVTDVVYGSTSLANGTDFTVIGNELTILKEYLSGLNLVVGSSADFVISFDAGDNATYTINFTLGAAPNTVPKARIPVPTQTVTEGGMTSFVAYDIAEDADGDTMAITDIRTAPAITIATADLNNETVTITGVNAGSTSMTVRVSDGEAIVDVTVPITVTDSQTPAYTLTIAAGSGGSITTGSSGNYTAGTVINIAAAASSKYSFNKWTSSGGGTFGNVNSASTTFNMPANAATITAGFTYISGSGSNTHSTPTLYVDVEVTDIAGNDLLETTLPVTVDQNEGSAALDVDAQLGNIITSGGTVVITAPYISGVTDYILGVPVAYLSTPDGGGTLTFNTDTGNVTIPTNMLADITGAEGKKVEITIGQGDKSSLPEAVQTAIGHRPLIQMAVSVDGEQTEWNNPDAPVTISIPYTPTAEELSDPEHITVWYIDGSGNVVEVPSGRYDPATGTVTFSTTHFSNYAVAYVTKAFEDLGSVGWARKPVEVLASKGILKGTSEKEYAPQTNITRTDFLYFLVRTLGVDAKVDGNFDDISRDAYYYKEIGIAKKLGITQGTGNNKFSPDASITRQDMMVLTERALRMLKKLEVQGTASELYKFADKSLVAAYAVNGVASVVKEGLIVGSGNKVNPLGNTTRAEAAVFLYRIYNKY